MIDVEVIVQRRLEDPLFGGVIVSFSRLDGEQRTALAACADAAKLPQAFVEVLVEEEDFPVLDRK